MMPGTRTSRAKADAVLAVAVLAAVWKLGSMAIGADIVLPAPERVLSTLLRVASDDGFAAALSATALRGLASFGISMALGVSLGFAAGLSDRCRAMLAPALTVTRATPVLAIILLAMIWFPSGIVPVFSAVVMAFPVAVADVAAGVRSTDPRLLDMARSFGVPARDIAARIRFPSAAPHLASAARNVIGLSWKVVVAGEVLSQPARAVGTGMQNARVMLETAEVFAWVTVGILLCAVSDALFDLLSRRLSWTTK